MTWAFVCSSCNIGVLPTSLVHPAPVLPADDDLVNVKAVINNLPAVDKVILASAPVRVFLVARNASTNMPLDEPPSRDVKINVNEPQLVHEGGGVAPHGAVERDVVALEDDDAARRVDGDVALARVLDGVVEARGADGGRVRRQGGAQGAHEGEEGGAVEGVDCAAAGVGLGWVG